MRKVFYLHPTRRVLNIISTLFLIVDILEGTSKTNLSSILNNIPLIILSIIWFYNKSFNTLMLILTGVLIWFYTPFLASINGIITNESNRRS